VIHAYNSQRLQADLAPLPIALRFLLGALKPKRNGGVFCIGEKVNEKRISQPPVVYPI
jgi:hypothetical protein